MDFDRRQSSTPVTLAHGALAYSREEHSHSGLQIDLWDYRETKRSSVLYLFHLVDVWRCRRFHNRGLLLQIPDVSAIAGADAG